MSKNVSEFAPAKVNLCLHITGRREDGYHLLDSLVAFADTGDELDFTQGEDTSLSICGLFGANLESEPDNLVLRAANALKPHAAATQITLTKNLPVAGGIGGGSADAAAALRGMISLHEISDLADSELDEIALSLGADVPACFRSKALRMSGIGEEIMLVPSLPEVPAVLVNPLIAVPTGPVFKELGLKPGAQANDGLSDLPAGGFNNVQDLADWLRRQRNDLEPPAVSLVPEVAEVLDKIGQQTGCLLARMSGSGATCFGLFESVREAEAAATSLANSNPGWWIAATKLS